MVAVVVTLRLGQAVAAGLARTGVGAAVPQTAQLQLWLARQLQVLLCTGGLPAAASRQEQTCLCWGMVRLHHQQQHVNTREWQQVLLWQAAAAAAAAQAQGLLALQAPRIRQQRQ